jgi:hypothetical protein
VSVHGDRLVVVGGSIGGLIAARVLRPLRRGHHHRAGRPARQLGPAARRATGRAPARPDAGWAPRAGSDIYGNDSFTIAMRYVGAAYLDFCKHQAVSLPEGWLRCAPSDVEVSTAVAHSWSTSFGLSVGAPASLQMTQPVATRTLQELEAILGVPLYERGPRGCTRRPSGKPSPDMRGPSSPSSARRVDK